MINNKNYKHYGIDVSHHQDPNLFDWEAFEVEYDFIIARCTYGTTNDDHFDDFRNKCLELNKHFGAYHFFRQTKSVSDQIENIEHQLKIVHYGGGKDIYPALDIEENKRWDGPVNPKLYNKGGEAIADWMKNKYGACLIYISPAFWTELGKPSWVLEHRIWTAHWDVNNPSKVGNKIEDIWQFKVKKVGIYPDPSKSIKLSEAASVIDLNYCRDINHVMITDEVVVKNDTQYRTDLTKEEEEKVSNMMRDVDNLFHEASSLLKKTEELRDRIEAFISK